MARRSTKGKQAALAYVRNRVLPPKVVRTARAVRARKRSTGDDALDRIIRRSSSDDVAAVHLASAARPVADAADDHQIFQQYQFDSALELLYVTPDIPDDVDQVFVSISAEYGDESAPGTSSEDGAGATNFFAPLYLPDVLSRLSRTRTSGPVKIVIRGTRTGDQS